jgi:acetyl-CoA acetyltransferase
VAAIDAGSFTDEIAPIAVVGRDGTSATFAVDEHPRRSTSMEVLAGLKPIHPEIDGFSITAGNSSGLNDGAAAMVVADRSLVDAHDLDAIATVRAWASVGVAPERTGMAPTEAIPKLLERSGTTIDDIALWEINEAFASMCVATTRTLGNRRVDRQRARERLQPRTPDRHDRRAHGDQPGARAAPSRRRSGCGGHVRRRWHVHGGPARGPRAVAWRRHRSGGARAGRTP